MAYRLDRLVRYVRGWMTRRQESRFAHPKVPAGRGARTSRVNYFGISDYYRPIPEIDSCILKAHPYVLLETVALGAHQGP